MRVRRVWRAGIVGIKVRICDFSRTRGRPVTERGIYSAQSGGCQQEAE